MGQVMKKDGSGPKKTGYFDHSIIVRKPKAKKVSKRLGSNAVAVSVLVI